MFYVLLMQNETHKIHSLHGWEKKLKYEKLEMDI